MPDITFASRDAIPEALRQYAKDVEGGGVVINLVANETLKEFRENNIAISKERDDFKKVVDEIKTIFPEFDSAKINAEIADLRSTQKRVKDGELTESKAIEEALNERTKELKTNLEGQLAAARQAQAAANTEKNALAQRLKANIVRQHITQAALDPNSGVQPSAVEDIVQRAMGLYHVTDDEKLIPKQGDTVLYGSDGATPMPPSEWLGTLKEKSPHLFKQSAGGGGGAGEKRFGGFSQTEVEKMSPEQKLAIANEATRPKGF